MVKHIKQFDLNTPTWEEIFFNLNSSIELKESIINEYQGFFVSHNAHRIKTVEKVLDRLNLKEAHSYINIINSPTFGEHKDIMDVWYWQVKGSTKWTIEKEKEYILSEGDLIYIPTGVLHNVMPLGPRVGISMSL